MKNLFPISITIAATLALAFGYAMSSLWPGAVAVVTLGLGWAAGQRRQFGWPTDLGFIALMIAAAIGVWWGAGAGWMLLGAAGALAAWDLARFARRLGQAEHLVHEARLQQAHRQRLLPVVVLGLGLGGIALSIQLKLSFGWAIVLGLVVIIGLSRVVISISSHSEHEEKP